jgi:hypothetical protein
MRRNTLNERDLSRIVKRVLNEASGRFNDFFDELTYVRDRIELAKDCDELDNIQDPLAHLENFLHHDKQLSDDEWKYISKMINKYYDLVSGELQQCYED